MHGADHVSPSEAMILSSVLQVYIDVYIARWLLCEEYTEDLCSRICIADIFAKLSDNTVPPTLGLHLHSHRTKALV